MRSSFATAWAVNSAGGSKMRSSRRRSANSAFFASAMPEILLAVGLPSQRGEARAHWSDERRVRERSVLQKRSVVLDGRRAIAVLVGNHREVVMRARASWIDR